MPSILIAVATFVWANRVMILGLITTFLPSYGPQITKWVEWVSPIVEELVAGGAAASVGEAVVKVAATALAPHAMTDEERDHYFDRAQGGAG